MRLHLGETFGPILFNLCQTRTAHINRHSKQNLENPLNNYDILWTDIISYEDEQESLFDDAMKNENFRTH